MLTDLWKRQKARVQTLAQRSRKLDHWADSNRRMFRTWAKSFGEPEVIAWSFAGGLLWAAGRGTSRRRLKSGRSVLQLTNSALLVWKFINQVQQVKPPR